MRLIRLKEVSEILGVHVGTVRKWSNEDKIKTHSRTQGGHRLYDYDYIMSLHKTPSGRVNTTDSRITIGYARVSSYDQKKDLKTQTELLELYCCKHGWCHEIIQDLGSGMNYNKKGLKLLLRRLCGGEVGRLVITHKDRLLRFGAELIFEVCGLVGCEVVIINKSENTSYEEDLTEDVLEIITVFSARLYSSRSNKNKKIVETLKDISKDL